MSNCAKMYVQHKVLGGGMKKKKKKPLAVLVPAGLRGTIAYFAKPY